MRQADSYRYLIGIYVWKDRNFEICIFPNKDMILELCSFIGIYNFSTYSFSKLNFKEYSMIQGCILKSNKIAWTKYFSAYIIRDMKKLITCF